MRNIDTKLILIGLIYFVLAMIRGQWMAFIADYSYYPMHAHMALVGGALMILYGLIFRAFPTMQQDALTNVQFWTANIAAPIFFVGIGVSVAGGTRYVGHTGSILVILALALFAVIFFRGPASGVSRD